METIRKWIDGETAEDLVESADEHAKPRRVWEEFLVKIAREVETVINHRMINGRHIVAGVSGGVMVAPMDVLREPRARENSVKYIAPAGNVPKDMAAESWWWDAANNGSAQH